jgi:L-alanine-DL-glutamate epimerase-like enolase superfamily enzyme
VRGRSRIARLSARRLDVPLKRPFGISRGAQQVAANILVEMVLEGGVRGWGEGAPFPAFNGETQDQALAACVVAAPLLTGRDVRHSGDLGERVASACGGSSSAVCAIETAILDCQAQLQGLSIRELLGGVEQEVVTDITITTGSVEDAEQDARAYSTFSTLKIKIGGGPLERDIGGMVETRLAMGTSASIAAGLGGFTYIDLDTPLFLAEDPFEGGYVQDGERIDLRPIGIGHGCAPREKSGLA